ncbi:MAG: DUF5683 domain-containing protein [Bacteroidota bacterium]
MIFFNKKIYHTKRLFQIIGITFFIFLSNKLFAQITDTTKPSIQNRQSTIRSHSPRKAALFSTVLPGLGQAYNKKYWKIPVIYGGFAALGYFINSNQTKYVRYRDAYKYRIDNDPATVDDYEGKYTDDNLNTLQQYYHRYRDLSVIGAALLYIINIVDASVDAHMFTFDVDDNLSFNIRPTSIYTASVNRYTSGLSLSIKF